MRLVVEIEMNGAAFHDSEGNFAPGPELGYLFGRLRDRAINDPDFFDEVGEEWRMLDSMGNTTGKWEVLE